MDRGPAWLILPPGPPSGGPGVPVRSTLSCPAHKPLEMSADGTAPLGDPPLVLQRQGRALAVKPTDQLPVKARRQCVIDQLVHEDRTADVMHPLRRRRSLQEQPAGDGGAVLLH